MACPYWLFGTCRCRSGRWGPTGCCSIENGRSWTTTVSGSLALPLLLPDGMSTSQAATRPAVALPLGAGCGTREGGVWGWVVLPSLSSRPPSAWCADRVVLLVLPRPAQPCLCVRPSPSPVRHAGKVLTLKQCPKMATIAPHVDLARGLLTISAPDAPKALAFAIPGAAASGSSSSSSSGSGSGGSAMPAPAPAAGLQAGGPAGVGAVRLDAGLYTERVQVCGDSVCSTLVRRRGGNGVEGTTYLVCCGCCLSTQPCVCSASCMRVAAAARTDVHV